VASTQKRWPRVQRTEVEPIHLTEADRRVLTRVYESCFLSPRQLAELHTRGAQNVLRRWQLLSPHGDLDRVPISRHHAVFIDAIAPRGADGVGLHTGNALGRVKRRSAPIPPAKRVEGWQTKARQVGLDRRRAGLKPETTRAGHARPAVLTYPDGQGKMCTIDPDRPWMLIDQGDELDCLRPAR
jgi:hypothetical protein